MQPQPQVHIVNAAPQTSEPRKFDKQSQKACGIIQIALGAFAFFLAIASIVLRAGMYYVGTGIWCSVFIIIAGVLGVVSAKNERTSMIVSCMVMSILSSIFAAVYLSMASVACALDESFRYYRPYRYIFYDFGPYNVPSAVAVDVLGILVGFIEFFVAIVQSAVCCRATCCASSTNAASTVVYFQQPYHGYQPQPMGMTMTPVVGPSGQVPLYQQQPVQQQPTFLQKY